MTNSLNNGNYSRLSVDPTLGGMVDGVDFPHTGVFKALAIAAQGNFAILNAATSSTTENFSIVQTDSSGNTQFVVGSGMVMRDGKAILVPSNSATTTFTSGTPSTFDAPASTGNGYFLLVAKADNTLGIRDNGNRATLNTVPQLTAGDIPIAMIRLAHGETSDQRQIQYFTTAKSENSVSVGYNASTVYTETMSVIGDADRTTFKNKIANADIRFVLADNTADEKFEILTDDDSDGDEGDTSVFSVDGLGAIEVNADSVTTDNVLDITADGLTTGAALNIISDSSSTATRNIVYIKNDHASAVNATVLKVESDADSESQAPVFHVKTAGAGAAVLIESTEDSADEAPEMHFYRNAGAGTASDDLGTIRFYGQDDADNKFEYAHIFADSPTVTNGAELGRMLLRTKSGGTYMNCLQLETGLVRVNGSNQDINFIHTADDGGVNFFSDAGTNKIGIGTTSPNAKLHITDSGSGDHLILEGTLGSSTTSAPNLVLFRNGADAAADIDDNDLIGQIVFRGENDNSTPQEVNYATIEAGMDDTTDGSEDGHITFNLIEAGVLTEFMRLRAATRDVVVNEQADDIDFRCEGSSDANLLFVDADANKVGIGLNTPKTKLTVEGAITLKEQVNADADTAAYGQLWTKTATPNELYFTNDAGNDIQLTTGAKGPLLQGKHSIWIPAEAISPRSNAGCADLTLTPAATNGRPDIRGLAFDGATREHAQFTIAMPKMWDGGDVTARFYWTTIASGTGNVMWGIRGVSLSDNDAIDTGFGSLAVTAPDGVLATKDVHITDESGGCTIGGSPAALDICCFQVVRESDQSNDTLNSVDCVLLGVKLFYTIDKGNDA